MDFENISWISHPNVCRCCLSASGVLDITDIYVNESGLKEILDDVLRNCLGITLSHTTSLGASKRICKLCADQLQEIANFHKQVTKAEKCYDSYWRRCKDKKSEPDVLKENAVSNPVVICKEDNYDSDDAPIASFVRNSNKNDGMKNYNNARTCYEEQEKITDIYGKMGNFINDAKMEKSKKYVSERKRIILTCATVLRETTACPFRHHKSWFQCFFCTQDFMEIQSLRDHTLQLHADIDDELKKIKRYPRSLQIDITFLECRLCQLNLTDVDSMKRHFLEKHEKIIYKEYIADYKVNCSPYACHLCKMEFHVFRTLTTHLNEHYANCICDVCGKSFLNSKRLKVHTRTHENGNYPCTECGKVLRTKTSKANHMESAHSKRTVKCQICLKPMKHYNDRIKHMSEVHNITHKFKCPICSREYNVKHYLASHIRQTHGHKNKKCMECGMAFVTNHGLKKHMLRHTGDRPFSCNICSKSYARSYTLREHMRIHDNDKRLTTPP